MARSITFSAYDILMCWRYLPTVFKQNLGASYQHPAQNMGVAYSNVRVVSIGVWRNRSTELGSSAVSCDLLSLYTESTVKTGYPALGLACFSVADCASMK